MRKLWQRRQIDIPLGISMVESNFSQAGTEKFRVGLVQVFKLGKRWIGESEGVIIMKEGWEWGQIDKSRLMWIDEMVIGTCSQSFPRTPLIRYNKLRSQLLTRRAYDTLRALMIVCGSFRRTSGYYPLVSSLKLHQGTSFDAVMFTSHCRKRHGIRVLIIPNT